MSWQALFQRYGRPSEDGEVSLRGYFRRPESLKEPVRIASADRDATRLIEEAREAIEALQDYRRALAERYAALATMPSKPRLELERLILRDGHKAYQVRIVRVYQDGTEVPEISETYPGKDRRSALARFEALCKERPGIEIVKDIERRRWEH